MVDDPAKRQSRVPSGRFSRLLQLGTTAGRMAAGGAAEQMKRIAKRAEEELPHALLTAKNARLLAERLSKLRGAAMKVGQMLSMEGDNLLPPEFAKALEILRSSAHRMPNSQVKEVLARELGPDYLERFGSLELTPMASASIGQVHRATTRDGASIVLKIQYPGVAESIDSDVDNLRSLLALTRLAPRGLNLDALTREVKAELRREVDYARELEQLVAYRAAVGENPDVRVPRAYPELSTPRILAMELIPGLPLLEWSRTASQEARDRAGRLLVELLLKEFFEYGLMQTDPNPANYFYDPAREQLILLDFGAAREVPVDTRELYRRAFRGIAERDEVLLGTVLDELAVVAPDATVARQLVLDMALEASSVFTEGTYDFRKSGLSERLTVQGKQLSQHQNDLRPPPPAYIFFQRKLGGTFLLCRNLGARVDCHQLLRQYGIVDR